MKKIYLTFMMMMLATIVLQAQAQLGIRAGFNVSTISDEREFAEAEPWRPGLNLGIASQFRSGEIFAFAPEIMYTQRGFREEYANGVVREARFDYLSVPILFRLHFGDILKGYINAGPTLGYWLGGKQISGVVDAFDVLEPYEENIAFDESGLDWAYNASRFELGGAIGGGIMLDTEGGTFLIDLRYTFGFTNVADFADTDSYKNRVVSVSLIYLLPSVRGNEYGY